MVKSFWLSFTLALNVGIAGASVQKAATKKRQQSSISSSAANKSRPRRALVTNRSAGSKPSATEESTPARAAKLATETSVKPAAGPSNFTEEPIEEAETTSTDNSDNTEKHVQAEPPTVLTDDLAVTPSVSLSLREQIEMAQRGPERIRLQLRLAEQLSATGQKAEAVKELHTITRSDVFDPQGFYNAGNALARLGDSHEAINAYRKAIVQRKGRYSRALNNLGVVLFHVGQWDEAYEALISALTLESFHYAEASYNLGRVYYARGERDLAFREWRRALKVDPEHHAAARALANGDTGIVMRSESTTKAGSPTGTVKGDPRGPARDTRIARSPKNIGAARSANPSQVFKLDAISYELFQRARDLKDHGKLQEAAKNYEQVISRSRGYFAPANLELSYVLRTLKRNDEALANLLKVMKRDGAQYPIIYYHVARLYEMQGDLVSAEESYARAALVYKAENNSFLLDLVRVRERQGNFTGALAALEEYVTAMEKQGMKPLWADDRLAVLRKKSSGAQVQPK